LKWAVRHQIEIRRLRKVKKQRRKAGFEGDCLKIIFRIRGKKEREKLKCSFFKNRMYQMKTPFIEKTLKTESF